MSTKYFVLLTNIGAAKLANATVLGSHLDITHMAVGDGGGTLPTPNPAQTALINEKRRAGINTLSVDPVNTNQIIAEQVIPENEGGFWIREIGLFDADGDLVAIGNCAETYKPLLQEGSGRIQTVRMILIVSSTDAVTLKIDPAVVLATRGYVDDAINAHEKSRKHPDGTLNAKGFVQLSNATNSDSELLAATPKAVKAAVTAANNAATAAANANTNANGRVPSARKVNGKELTADIALIAADVGAYTKAETDTRVATATTAANNAATAAANANINANGRVPSARKVNGKALTADIALTATDVGAYTKAETDTRVATATTAANNAATAAANANTNANGRVPSGRTVNGKALSADIALGAGDVGAYTKAETDTRVTAATTAANNAATAATNANTNANGRVPSGRTVNGKALSADIVLTAGDVGALTAGGTAAAATKLATARKINGVAFDGSADIIVDSDWSQIKNVPAASYDVAGVVVLSSSINSNSRTIAATAQQLFTAHSIATNALAKATAALPADGTAAAATKLATPRKINGVAFDGTSDIDLNGSRVWISGEYTPATSTPIVVSHGLVGINPLHCRCDVLVKCVVAEGEYRAGEFAINPMTLFMQQGVAHPYSLLPALNAGTVQLNIMHYLAASFKTSTIGNQQLNMANWRCILRIFY
ncbi:MULTISPECIES: phage tail protein [Pectobacterium]|uniref:Tail fiber repeat 2 protein n=1 Tax=Pectobacterium carotovorum subsp. carotovorum (strain PC1) TaxID=561230 RepID=C6D9F9_PECCP|nr:MULTISPECIES: phage tail protein [Pectobacterium]ACT13686.1 tail fiber repeat 2 protein [Pectobacterium carotovorum subsp. carotovorum PC1]UFT92984.1 phage tail protein [Pectobacterium carotovorum]